MIENKPKYTIWEVHKVELCHLERKKIFEVLGRTKLHKKGSRNIFFTKESSRQIEINFEVLL